MLIRTSPTSTALIDMGEEVASVSSGSMSLSVHNKYGAFINGPLSVSSPPTSITLGGFYKFNPVALSGMPSTLITPVPTFEVTVPTKNIAIQNSINSVVVSSITGLL